MKPSVRDVCKMRRELFADLKLMTIPKLKFSQQDDFQFTPQLFTAVV